jgi:hypothetical protein
LVLALLLLPGYAADAAFCEVLEAPPGEVEVIAVPSVRVLVVEDGLEGFGRFGGKAVGADVDASVGVGGEDFDARSSKGSSTSFMYMPSAASARSVTEA